MIGRGIRIVVVACLVAPGAYADEIKPQSACFEEEVLLHVRAQFAHYGPLSERKEFFGFIFRIDGRVEGAVTRGTDCGNQSDCVVNPLFALARVPKGAKVLGEWHTHPRIGTRGLSMEDVRGANANRHIRCYSAFYSSPDGEIYRWNVAETSVAAAMASRMPVGNYRANHGRKDLRPDAVADDAAIIAMRENPGIQCLSTNTNVHTAATTKKCCRRSTTSRSPSARAAGKRDCASSCPPPCSA